MTKTEMEVALARQLGISKEDARALLNALLDEIMLALNRGQRVSLPGFGAFEVRPLAARQGRNPRTGQPMQIQASNTVAFRPGKALKQAIANMDSE